MMIPPAFCDLGKTAKDLFNKNFNFGQISVDYQSKSSQGVELSIKGDSDVKAAKLSGSAEWKYRFENGLTNVVKWDTKNVLSANLSIEDLMVNGTKLETHLGFHPDSGSKSLKMKAEFKRSLINAGVNFNFPQLQPVVTPSLILGCTGTRGYLSGAEITYDTSRMALTSHKFSIGYHKKDELSVIGTLVNKTDIEALIFQKISPEVDLGVQIKWSANSRITEFGVAAKYSFDEHSFVKGKIDDKSQLGLAYLFRARDNVQITLCANIDTKDLEKGSHRFGLGLSYAP